MLAVFGKDGGTVKKLLQYWCVQQTNQQKGAYNGQTPLIERLVNILSFYCFGEKKPLYRRIWLFIFGTLYNTKDRNSLLDPAHFNSILYGSCLEKNKIFNECSKLAYENSTENENCMEKKHQCEAQNILERDKQEEIKKMEMTLIALKRTQILLQDALLLIDHSPSNLNNPNRRIKNKLDRINKKLTELNAPEFIVQNEQRILQEDLNSLIREMNFIREMNDNHFIIQMARVFYLERIINELTKEMERAQFWSD